MTGAGGCQAHAARGLETRGLKPTPDRRILSPPTHAPTLRPDAGRLPAAHGALLLKPTLQGRRTRPRRPASAGSHLSPRASRPRGHAMRIFISYKRDTEPDVPVARQICNTLRQEGHEVFIDRDLTVGARWAERIEDEMRRSDFLITLLSEHSVHSEMVRGEGEMAYNFGQRPEGRPRILPVRLAYREPFANPLSAWLNPINWALWDSPDDTPRLLDELLLAIAGGALPVAMARSSSSSVVESAPQGMPLPLPSADRKSTRLNS